MKQGKKRPMTESETKTLQILVIRGSAPDQDEPLDSLTEQGQVETVGTLGEALELIQTRPFDVVIGPPSAFRSVEPLHLSPQATAILETVTQGVCIVGEDGELVWANPKMLSFNDAIQKRICQLCVETFSWATSENTRKPSLLRGRRFSFTTDDHEYLEITATPVIDLNNRVTQVAAVVWDATRARRIQEKIDAVDNAGRELMRLDAEQVSRLNAHERLALLEQKIIRFTRDMMHFENFVVRVLDKRTNKLEVVLALGMPEDAQEMDLYSSSEGNGICGVVAHTGRSYICPDVAKDARYMLGIPSARSSLTVPLRLNDEIIGVFNIESERAAAFTEEDRQFAEIFGRHLAMALHMLDLLVTEHSTATGQVGVDVLAEITGPVNDILTDVAELIEDHIGHDELRHRLNKICDNAVAIREAVKRQTTPSRGVLGAKTPGRGAHRDPVLTGKRLLVADDEDIIRETVRDVLVSKGCEVHEAGDGEVALQLLRDHEIDLVLSDIKMPHKNGYEVFAAAKDKNAKCPVILMTGFGYDPNHAIVRARKEGLAAVLFKPFKVDQLLGEIRQALMAVEPH